MHRLRSCGGPMRVVFALLLATGHCAFAAEPEDTDWPLLGNAHEMQHHAALSQINTDTVGRLGLAWWVDLPAVSGLVGNPLIRDGRVFQSGAGSRIFANDLRTGELLWTFDPRPDPTDGSFMAAYGMLYNRGVALHEDLVIVGTGDCRLVAVDQETGALRWEAQACDTGTGRTITAAPRVGGGMVFTGNACGDAGSSRGHVDAFDADTGRRAWRFYTVPGDPSKPPESDLYRMAAATWGHGWYERTKGCGSVWDAMVYDPRSERLYIGVGGPSPLVPTGRGKGAGDELFTNSIVALDAKTGEYVWHFKQNPGDGWNFEPAVGLMLANVPDVDVERRVVISVPKDGFVYVLDADTGEFLSGRNYVPANWASGLDEEGRPIYLPDARYWERPDGRAVVVPGGMGGHNWEALAFDPEKHVVFIPAATMPALYEASAADGLMGDIGVTFDGEYGSKGDPDWEAFGELVAWDPVLQTEVWRARHALPMNGGALHTAGGLVFQGLAEGYLVAYDAATGERLWEAPAGGTVRSAPSTVMADGRQYIVVSSGNVATSVGATGFTSYSSVPRSRGRPRLLAFALDGSVAAPPWAEMPHIPAPPVERRDAGLASAGAEMFVAYGCDGCHGHGGVSVGGASTDLRLRPPATPEYLRAVLDGALVARGMPTVEMTDEGVEALHAYLVNLAWDAHEGEDTAH